jgi:hypothetical protein
MKKQNIIYGVIIGVALVVAGVSGWFIWQNQQKTPVSSVTPTDNLDTRSYLTIKEWGVKIDIGAADPGIVEYAITGDSAALSLKAIVTNKAACRNLGLTINRGPAKDAPAESKKVGNYSYVVADVQAPCGDTVLDQLRQQYGAGHPSTWLYTTS